MRRVFIPIRQMYYFKEKNMKRINSLLYMGLMGIVLLSSCDAQLDQVNPNAATEETFWQNEADFEKALVSCYTPLKNALNGGYYGTRGVMMRIARADEVEFRNDIKCIRHVILRTRMEIPCRKVCSISSTMPCIARTPFCRDWKKNRKYCPLTL